MDGLTEQLLLSLKFFKGSRITQLARIFYEFGGEIDTGDGFLEIESEGRVVLMENAADGESLRLQERPWQDPFTGELSKENVQYINEYGRWRRIDCSKEKDYSSFIGQVITKICILENEHGTISGICLSVYNRSLWFVVEGDECHIYWAHPIGFRNVSCV